MPDSAPSYNLSTIHRLLVATFTAEELRRFCRDRPALCSIVDRFGPRQGLEDMIDEVIDYCRTRDLFDQLVSEIKQANPAQYARFEPSLRADSEALAIKILKPGNTLQNGKYRIDRHLARGGFGSVYLAEDTLLHDEVAIKELIPVLVGDDQALRRFLVEAKTTMKLAHPHVAHTRDLFPEAGNYYMVMEWAPGGSLEDRLRDNQALAVDEAVRIAAQVASGLAYAHARGVVHCDLKPGNILFGGDGSAKVADFGVAHVSEHTLTRSWTTGGEYVAGTLPYMSPEQTDGVRDDPRVDVYALGAVLYRMLTGRTYIEFDERDTPRAQAENVRRICDERPAAPSLRDERIPPWLDRVVLKALAKRPEGRFATMDELQAALLRPPRPRARPAPVPRPARAAPVVLVPEAPAAGLEEVSPRSEEEAVPELAAGPGEQGELAAEAPPLPLPVAALIAEVAPEAVAVESAVPAGPLAGDEGPPSGEAPVEPAWFERGSEPEGRPSPAPSSPIPAAAVALSRPGAEESALRPKRARAPLPVLFWPMVLGGGVLLVVLVIGLVVLLGGGPGGPTPAATIAAMAQVTETATPTGTPLPTYTPAPATDTPAPPTDTPMPATPTPQPTATLVPMTQPTSTPPPTKTATPTAQPTNTTRPQPTETPRLAPTRTPTAKPTFPALALVGPADGQEFAASDAVVLQWNPVGLLPADGYYVVMLAYTHNGATWTDDTPWTKQAQWAVSEHTYLLDLSDDGRFRWSVRVMHRTGTDAQGRPIGVALSPASSERTFTWRRTGGEPSPRSTRTTPATPTPAPP